MARKSTNSLCPPDAPVPIGTAGSQYKNKRVEPHFTGYIITGYRLTENIVIEKY
jgi:hypothetical protein